MCSEGDPLKYIPLILVVFALLLSACTPPSVQIITPSTTVQPSPLPTASFTPTQTPSPVPSAEPNLTQTAIFSKYATAQANRLIPTVTPILRPTAPGEAKFTKLAWDHGSSPDMKWFWAKEEEPGKRYFVTHFVNAEGTIESFVHPEEGQTEGTNLYYEPYFWLPNEPYVYLIGQDCCGDVGPATHYFAKSLARLNLETGQLSMILGWNAAYSVDFSLGGKYLVYSIVYDHNVHILELRTGKEKVAELNEKYRDIGRVPGNLGSGWSPDLTRVIQEIYMGCASVDDYECYKEAFVIVQTATGEFQIIDNPVTRTIGTDNQWDYQIGWVDEDHVRLMVHGKPYVYPVDIPTPEP